MGVFKWLRRERLTVTRKVSPAPTTPENRNEMNAIGTIRTEDYKRDLAEFQARRSSGQREISETPKKSRCGTQPLSVSCTDCATESPDKTFTYEKRSAAKYKKNKQCNSQTSNKSYEAVPNVQFLFQGQVFLPGNIFPAPYSDPVRGRQSRRKSFSQIHKESHAERRLEYPDETVPSPPLFYKDNPLPCDENAFLESHKSDDSSIEKIELSSQSDEVDSREKFGSCEDKLKEVLYELKTLDQWADEQLQERSLNSSRNEGNKSDTSVYGLPVVDLSDLDLSADKTKSWNSGQWGVIPVRIRKLTGVSIELVRTKQNSEIEILKKCRHPNIVLLMGVYPDIRRDLHLICEHFLDTLFDILHVQGPVLTIQKSIDYASDIASALVFLHMQGYVHTDLSSHKVVITRHDAAKLADLSSCVKYRGKKRDIKKSCDIYSLEPHYVNIDETPRSGNTDNQPLLSKNSSEVYLNKHAVSKPYNVYSNSPHYRWQAPELHQPDSSGFVYPCSKSDVYSLSLIIWECCNAAIPWKSLSYDKLKELYVVWKTGIRLPQDGSYPGTLLDLLQGGLKLDRSERIDLKTISERLQIVKKNLKGLPEIIIPARLTKKLSAFSSTIWDSTSPSDSDILSPSSKTPNLKPTENAENIAETTDSDKESPTSLDEGIYEVIREEKMEHVEKCYISDTYDSDFENIPRPYNKLLFENKDYPSSACSTPISKPNKSRHLGTPGASLHRSDSTEYCSIFSPNKTVNENQSSLAEKSAIKLSRSFTPKNYKPLHIKVPEFNNLEGIKGMRKNRSEGNASFSFDIKNYTLPNTPIARSNKLRRNAWLSGDINEEKCDTDTAQNKAPEKQQETSPDISLKHTESDKQSPKTDSTMSTFTIPDTFNSHKKHGSSEDNSPPAEPSDQPERFHWYKPMERSQSVRSRIDDVSATVGVKPLVAIHEKWIYEANKKPGRSMSLPEDRRPSVLLKPASHTAAIHSAPLLVRSRRNSRGSDQFMQARDYIAKALSTSSRELSNDHKIWKSGSTDSKTTKSSASETKIDQSTDTVSIEEFIKQLIRHEFDQLKENLNNESAIDKGTANVINALKTTDNDTQKNKNYSRIKINGNNKPLLQISFSRNGENSLQVLDNCVNVTICDSNFGGKIDGFNQSFDDGENFQDNSLRRCQGFNALQEARSTEDLYIDDDISTQVQENFGGRVKLIPLHGSLHEILCEKQDECCLIKVKQENGCDTIYFRCDNSENKDQIDGQDTLLYTRSISLVEERIQRVPKKNKNRPKSEPTAINIDLNKETKVLSNSTPSLIKDSEPIEVNLETMSYQDSSSEECLKCQNDCEEFERLEKRIEEDVAHTNTLGFNCGCLEKISEENLSVIGDDFNERGQIGTENQIYS